MTILKYSNESPSLINQMVKDRIRKKAEGTLAGSAGEKIVQSRAQFMGSGKYAGNDDLAGDFLGLVLSGISEQDQKVTTPQNLKHESLSHPTSKLEGTKDSFLALNKQESTEFKTQRIGEFKFTLDTSYAGLVNVTVARQPDQLTLLLDLPQALDAKGRQFLENVLKAQLSNSLNMKVEVKIGYDRG